MPGRSGVGLKSFSKERQDAARAYAPRLVEERFAGNTTAAAKALGVSQSMLYDFLEGRAGLGPKLLERLAEFTGSSFDAVVGHVPVVGPSTASPAIAKREDFARALAVAKKKWPHIPAEAWEGAGRMMGAQPPSELTPAALYDFALLVLKYPPGGEETEEEREVREEMELERSGRKKVRGG